MRHPLRLASWLALVALVALAPAARAVPVHVPIGVTMDPPTDTPMQLPIDVDQDGVVDLEPYVSIQSGGQNTDSIGIELKGSHQYRQRFGTLIFDEGEEIGPALDAGTGWWFTTIADIYYDNGDLQFDWGGQAGSVPDAGYIGLRFLFDDGWHYGWIFVEEILNPFAPYRPRGIHVRDLAWESEPDTAILAGAVPEPSTAVLFGVGLAALRGRRAARAPAR